VLAISKYYRIHKNILTTENKSGIYSTDELIELMNNNEEDRVKQELVVSSTVIDWTTSTMTITTTGGEKHTIPLERAITVTMVGYPDREQKTMPARELGPYMSKGYIIEHISFEEGAQP
jgi:hypothetical protein